VDALLASITPVEQQLNTEDSYENSVSAEASEQSHEETSLVAMPSCSCIELTDDVMEKATRYIAAPSLLYEGASISTDTSHLLVSSYMCCHLIGQAQEYLLQLLQLFLPKSNNLPSSLYTLNKQVDHAMDITPDLHYFCTQYHSILPDNKATICSNQSCNITLNNSKKLFHHNICCQTTQGSTKKLA